jgi:3-methyl-2-oxobutanoate hydroxymethyltransferase
MRSAAAIRAITQADIPLMAHIGLTPQSVRRLGGYKVQRDASRLLEDARAVEEAGAFSVVLECVPAELATRITESLSIPTIGIGAGPGCDGQVLVTHDVLGWLDDMRPRFARRFTEGGEAIRAAAAEYCRAVRAGAFPGPEHQLR